MRPERWQEVRQLLDEALALPAAERSVYLDTICPQDPELRSEVESLLDSHEQAGSVFLNSPVADLKRDLGEPGLPCGWIGRRIGVYQIEAEIGHGGMGEVYRAVRVDGQYKKEVAIKLVRGGHDTVAVLERFLNERQILASLDHPNIARLYDGGTTQEGLPFLVMEVIEGTPIDQYCEEHDLVLNDRLKLFTHVCAAVQFAHQRLVIHRDIKPINILVTADGIPKLLDFGIAKILDPAAKAETTLLRPMTPEYASPEQVRGETITTATDVYALGVVLYRLLTGHSPYPESTRTPLEFARVICEVEPTKPSSAIAPVSPPEDVTHEHGADGDKTSARQQRRLKGDLDNIVLKALRKEPSRRYASVEQFAEDIRRHLQGLPVAATPDSVSYRVGKFVRRHAVGVAAVALILVAVASGIVATARQARIAEAQRRRAEARFNDVRKLANSLIFEVHDSIADLAGATAARKLILQRALEYLDSLSKESGNEPDLMRELATAYERVGALQGDPLDPNLGDIKGAAINLKKSVELRETLTRLNPTNNKDQVELAVAYSDFADFQSGVMGNIASGLDYNNRAISILDRVSVADPGNFRVLAQDTRAYTNLGFLHVGNGASGSIGTVKDGINGLKRALELDHRALQINPNSFSLRAQEAVINLLLGDATLKLGDRRAALDYYRRGAALFSVIDPKGTRANIAHNAAVTDGKIADIYLADRRIGDAIAGYRKSREAALRQAAVDPSNQNVKQIIITSSGQLGHALVEGGRIDDGLKYLREALERIETEPALTPLYKIYQSIAHAWVGEAFERRGRIADALAEYRKGKEAITAARAAGADDLRTRVYYCASTGRLAEAMLKSGNPTEATKQYEECRGILEPLLQANPDNEEVLYALAETYTGEGDVSVQLAKGPKQHATSSPDWNSASEWYQKSLNIWSKVPNPAWISTSMIEVRLPAEVSQKLAQCRSQTSTKVASVN
jgi:serine/threonine protein kinase/tetratricopeptide (TPR) repeat protein